MGWVLVTRLIEHSISRLGGSLDSSMGKMSEKSPMIGMYVVMVRDVSSYVPQELE